MTTPTTRVEPVMSQLEIARASLTQAEEYVPRDEWGRRGKARNIAQIKAFIVEAEAGRG